MNPRHAHSVRRLYIRYGEEHVDGWHSRSVRVMRISVSVGGAEVSTQLCRPGPGRSGLPPGRMARLQVKSGACVEAASCD